MSKNANTQSWTPRSQKSLLRQAELEREREEMLLQIEAFKRTIAEAEVDRARLAKSALKGAGYAAAHLERCVEDLRNKRESLAAREEVLRGVEEEIAACTPTPERAAARRRGQDQFAVAAEERLALDEKIDAQIAQLRELLSERQEITGRMTVLAQELEIERGLDQERFDALAAALPAHIAGQSQVWTNRMLGRWKPPVEAVARETVTLPETLAHPEIYHLGEKVGLTEEEFSELHRADRPAPGRKVPWSENYVGTPPWRSHPRSVWTREEYEAAKAKGDIENVIFLEERQADEENRLRFMEKNQKLVRVRVVRGEVLHDNRLIRAGYTGDIPYGFAKGLAQRGQVEILSAC